MGFLGSLFGWERRVRKLRKKWDHLREKALKTKEPIRSTSLKRLDDVESNLRMIEEQRLSRIDRARLAKEVEISLEEIKELIKSKPEELRTYRTAPAKVQ